MKNIIPYSIAILLLSSTVLALGAGVTPGEIVFEDMVYGQHAEQDIYALTSEANCKIEISIEGSTADWISLNTTEIIAEEAGQYKVRMSVDIPSDVSPDTYENEITVRVSSLEPSSGAAQITAGIVGKIFIHVTGVEVLDFQLNDAAAHGDTEEGLPLVLDVTITNKGNTRAQANIVFEAALSQEGLDNPVYSYETRTDFIASGSKETVSVNIPQDLDPDAYYGRINLYAGSEFKGKRDFVFAVLGRGSVAASADLLTLSLPLEAEPGQEVTIKSRVRNTGSVPIEAYLYTEVFKGDELKDVIESEKLIINDGKEQDFSVKFTPLDEGDYTIKARARFGARETAVKESMLTVKKPQQVDFLLYGGIALLVILVIVGAVIWHKKRQPF